MSAITITDLNNAKTDVDFINTVANSLALTATDRLGHTKDTVAGALYKIGGINNRGAWAGPGSIYFSKDIAQQGGTWYICTVAHTSSASFATDSPLYWRVYQGVTTGDLSAYSGAGLAGFGQNQSYGAGTVGAKLQGFISVKDYPFLAKGDGTTDDTAAIQAAIDFAITNKVGIFFPPGAYLVGSTLYLPDQTSNPYTKLFMFGHSGVQSGMDGASSGVTVIVTAASLFKTKTPPTAGSAMPNVELLLDGLQFKTNYVSNPTAVCFDTMMLWGAILQRCNFYGFNTWLFGAISRKTVIHDCGIGARRFNKTATAYTNSAWADSDVHHNYLSGLGATPAGMTTDPFIDITNGAQVSITSNYIDYTYTAVATGGSGQNVIIEDNVFDFNYTSILFTFGYPNCIVRNNKFFHINQSQVGAFPNPITGMSTNPWACIRVDNERCANKLIQGNQYNTADKFIVFGNKGHWNIIERDNFGTFPNSLSGLPVAQVDFGSRAVDTATYPLDNQYLYLDSIHGKQSSQIRGTRSAYIGLEYLIGSPPVKVRVNSDYSLSDMQGSYLWGKTNLLSGTDFSAGWTFGSGVTNPGGVFTASAGGGWSYYPIALAAGTYILALNITGVSGGIDAGYSLSGTPSSYNDSGIITNLNAVPGSYVSSTGMCVFQMNVSSTIARVGIFLNNPTTCTINYVHLIRIA